jgi:hypothetical protein
MEPTAGWPPPTPPAPGPPEGTANVRITGIDIGFGDLVVFLIKLTLAYIPALIILWIFAMILVGLFGGIFGGLLGAL